MSLEETVPMLQHHGLSVQNVHGTEVVLENLTIEVDLSIVESVRSSTTFNYEVI